jgi:hypothetical protein
MELVSGTYALIIDLRHNDTPVPADEAYRVAYARALRNVAELGDVPPPIADEARDALAALTG